VICAIIFDFDGVILDSVRVKTHAFAKLFSSFGPDAVRRMVAYHEAHGGISRFRKFEWFYKEIVGRLPSEAEVQDLGRQFEELAFDGVLGAPWIPGAHEFLEQNKNRYRCFVASGTPDAELRTIVQRRGLNDCFVEIQGSPATKDEIIRRFLNDHALMPCDTVFVGDAMTDYVAAHECGLRFVGVGAGSSFPEGTTVIPNLTSLAVLLGTLV